METLKRKIISFWLTHIFLRRIGKRYPDYFKQWIVDLTDDNMTREIMYQRYLIKTPKKFEAIAIDLNIALRRVFEKHKRIIYRIIGDV